MAEPSVRTVEVVERKGLGHPDTICDAVAEELTHSLCRFYLDRFGVILHHNVDKVLLWGGVARAAFGGGKILAPIEIFLCGRAADQFRGVRVPVTELAIDGTRAWLKRHLRHLDPDRDVVIHSLVRPGSADLVDLFIRQQTAGEALANDTSIGVGYAPLSALERSVLSVERGLNARTQLDLPALGEDIKVLGIRTGNTVDITMSAAMVDKYIHSVADYRALKGNVADAAMALASAAGCRLASLLINAADDAERGSLFLSVTGTSAEAGDDGEAGRGNRANGLITPYRQMTMESVAGKNPVNHVGKLYNVAAHEIASKLVSEIPGVVAAECCLVSRIGHPISRPWLVDVRLCDQEKRPPEDLDARARTVVYDHLDGLRYSWQRFLAGSAYLIA